MSLTEEDLQGDWNFYGKSKMICSKERFFNFHVPLALSKLLGLAHGDKTEVFVNLAKRTLVLKLCEKAKKEPEKRKAKKG